MAPPLLQPGRIVWRIEPWGAVIGAWLVLRRVPEGRRGAEAGVRTVGDALALLSLVGITFQVCVLSTISTA